MKKYLLICFIILILTGCKKEEITNHTECTINSEVEGIKVEGIYKITYTDNYIDNVTFNEKYTVSDEYLVETVEATFDALYKEPSKLKHYEYSRETNGLIITSTVNINYNKINLEELTKLDNSLKNILKDGKIEANTLINSYEANGATCKKID